MYKKILLSISFILIVTFVSFYPSLKNGFVNWDDSEQVTENAQIQDLSWPNIKNIFTAFHSTALYHPLVTLSYSLEYYFFLLNPLAYHLNNLILHLFNSLLVFWIILLLSDKIPIALVTAIFFGIHPLHVESVAWVTERKDVLYSFFFLGALIGYIYYTKKRDRKHYYLSVFLFFLSLLSKAMAITFPLVLFLCDYILKIKFKKRSLEGKTLFFIISFLFTILTLYGLYISKSFRQAPPLPFYHYLFFANYGLISYLSKFILPVKLCSFCPYPEDISTAAAVVFLIAPAITMTLAILVINSRKYTKKIIFGSLFFLITILPVIQILPSSKTIVADRYTYIPLLGLLYVAGEFFFFLYGKNFRYNKLFKNFLLIILMAVIASWSFLTFHRCRVWKDSITLWDDVLKKYPEVDLAYNNRGTVYYWKGDYDRAIAEYSQALKINPFSEILYTNRATAYYSKGNYDRAMANYNQALRIKPDYALAYNGRGVVYFQKGAYNAAISDYNQALRIKPDLADAYNKRGLAYTSKRDYDQAISDYTQVIKLNPKFNSGQVLAYNNRATAYLYKREYDKAISDYTYLLMINPNVSAIRYNRGNAYLDKEEYDKAIFDYTRAIKIKPVYAEAYYNRGMAYRHKGNYDRAILDYTRALRIKSNFANAYINRANAYSHQGEYDRAISDYTQAIGIKPDLADAYNNRAVAYLAQKDYDRAREDIQQAQKLGYKVEAGFLELLHHKK